MKKACILLILGCIWCGSSASYAQIINTFEPLHPHETVYSTSLDHLILTTGIDDPLRDGATYIVTYVSGARYTGQIDNFQEASYITLTFVSTIINRFLGLLALIALVYLIYHAFRLLLAYNDSEQVKNHRKAIYTAAIVIIGIGLSWLIVSAMFYIVAIITT